MFFCICAAFLNKWLNKVKSDWKFKQRCRERISKGYVYSTEPLEKTEAGTLSVNHDFEVMHR